MGNNDGFNYWIQVRHDACNSSSVSHSDEVLNLTQPTQRADKRVILGGFRDQEMVSHRGVDQFDDTVRRHDPGVFKRP